MNQIGIEGDVNDLVPNVESQNNYKRSRRTLSFGNLISRRSDDRRKDLPPNSKGWYQDIQRRLHRLWFGDLYAIAYPERLVPECKSNRWWFSSAFAARPMITEPIPVRQALHTIDENDGYGNNDNDKQITRCITLKGKQWKSPRSGPAHKWK
jgi:hypothetical protein